jgi:hypothetical protein
LRKKRIAFWKKIGSLSELLMITLNREDPDSRTGAIVGCNLVLTGQKPTLVRGGHRGTVEQRRDSLVQRKSS